MPENKDRKLILGVDLGGTKIAAALATAEGEILTRRYCPTLGEAGSQDIINSILRTIEETMSSGKVRLSQLLGIGIAAAGIIDSNKGMVITSPNIPNLREVPLKHAVEQRFGIPTYVGNDATLAALGEWYFGLKRSVANLIYITVSTGIGGGIITNGKLYTGACGIAGEIGHMTIDVNGPRCNCGNIGCWEALASGTALAGEAIREIGKGANTSIAEIVGGDLSRIDAKVVFQAAEGGDELANKLISRLAYYFGIGLVNLVNIFTPELILIGGGVAKMGDLLLQPAINLVKERAYVTLAHDVEIKPALLGDDSGVLGAVAFVLEHSGQM
jgi:glucokinase